jgi:thioredoxin 1
MVTLTEANFQQEVLESTLPVLVDFWAEWCAPCRMLAPVLEDLAVEYDGKVKIGKVNVDENQLLASRYQIHSIPTLLLFKDGEVVGQIVGARSKRELRAKLDEALA